MGSRKKGSELVFNLQWRNKSENGGDKISLIGMHETPATTLNFETFKSYLLKNSGVVGNDVKVTYLTDDGAEWVIDSQDGFEIALSAFRLKARLGEVIFLKLDKISSHQVTRKHSNDVETQFDRDAVATNLDGPPEWFLIYMTQFKKEVVEEVTYAVSANLSAKDKEITPPVVIVPKKSKPECSKRSRKHMMLGENAFDKDLLKTLKFDRKIESKLDKLDAKTKKIKEKKQALISRIDSEELRHRHSYVAIDQDGTPLMNAALVSEQTAVPHMVGGETYLHTWEVMNNGKLPWTPKTELRLTWGSADMKPSVNVISCPPLQPGEKGTVCVRFQIPRKAGQYESYWNFYDRDIRFGHWVSCCVIVDAPISCYVVENEKSKKAKMEPDHQQQNLFPEKPTVCSPPSILIPEKLIAPKLTFPHENLIIIQDNSVESEVEGAVGVSGSVIDLSRRMQDVKIAGSSGDSDSDWESLGSYGGRKPKNVEEEKIVDVGDGQKTNKYGINEKDLIVDLSTTSKDIKQQSPQHGVVEENSVENVQKEDEKQTGETSNSSDDNNNNGASVNNNSSGESICEIGSEASSDVSSGYDVINTPLCEEKEESSGYVYITIDGNKLPVPKYILRPDFVADAEAAPGPINSEGEEKIATPPPAPPTEEQNVSPKEPEEKQSEKILQYTKSFMKSMQNTTVSDRLSDFSPGQHTRVFIFPQDNPGFEVLYYPKGMGDGSQSEPASQHPFDRILYYPETIDTHDPSKKLEEDGERPPSPRDDSAARSPEAEVRCPAAAAEAVPGYAWAGSDTRYAFPDAREPRAVDAAHLRCDPYGPLEGSRPASAQGDARNFRPVPNYQQSTPRRGPQTPSAPPQPHRAAQRNEPAVHLLPENLVSGAVNVASSAINTARSVISMIVPPKVEGGKWDNGHWVTLNPESTRAKNLCILADMGFWDTDLNATLLARYNDDVSRVVSELLH